MSWLADYLDPNPVLDDLLGQIGALLVGRRTFGGDDPYRGTAAEGEPFGGGWSGPQFVLTHRLPDQPVAGVTFVDNLADALSLARAAAATSTSTCSAPASQSSAWRPARSTKSWCTSCRCCSVTEFGSSTERVAPTSSWSRSASRRRRRASMCG
ncbi:MAG: deaminase [Mycobacterium sp.]|jgi:hypothetical protein|nr:deaminase [Mycobacterium sp.]